MGRKNSGYRARSNGTVQAFKKKTKWTQKLTKQFSRAYNSAPIVVNVPRDQFLQETGYITPLKHYESVPPPTEE